MNAEQQLALERLPGDGPPDETDIGLRAYLTRLSDEHLAEYDSNWTDEQVMAWDGQFRNDGNLMLVCCERDIDIEEFRRVLHIHLQERRKLTPR
ncbi:hypothetical protein BH10PLA2_BH10PLA2_05140 [soil metagenome]